MPLGGSGSEMLNSVKNNRKLAHRRKSLKEIHTENPSGNGTLREYTFKQPTAEEMTLLRKKAARDKRRSAILRTITLGTLIILATYLLSFVFSIKVF